MNDYDNIGHDEYFLTIYNKYKDATSFDYIKDKEDFMLKLIVKDSISYYFLTKKPKYRPYIGWKGYTIAHHLAKHNKNFLPLDINILSLKNDDGDTVAHFLAKHNEKFSTTNMEILSLKNDAGDTVKYYLKKRQLT